MMKKITFDSFDNLKLVGIFSSPETSSPAPLIVMCHGYSSSKDSKSYTNLEELLIPLGVAVFRFDYRTHGESEGGWEDLTLRGVKEDIKSAISFLLNTYKDNIDKTKIILSGGSFSGLPVVWLASEDKRVKYLICRSGVIDPIKRYKRLYDLHEWKRQGWVESRYSDKDPRYSKLSYKIIEEVVDLSIKKVASNVKVPTLIFHGTDDKEVLPIHSQILFKHLGSKDKTLKLIPDSDHWYKGHREEMQNTIVEWVKEKL